MRFLMPMLLLLSCAVASVSWAKPPARKADVLKPGYVYQLVTGDVVAL